MNEEYRNKLIGKLLYMETNYKKELDIIDKYIGYLAKLNWKDVPIEYEEWKEENKYTMYEIKEYLNIGDD